MGITKEHSMDTLYLNCRMKKMRTILQEKKDVDSWKLVIGI
jgi:hypothetical protein